jgi:hypothetical protein
LALPLPVVLIGPAAADGFIDELKLGALAHDVPIFGTHVESGADINLEVLFAPLPFGDPASGPQCGPATMRASRVTGSGAALSDSGADLAVGADGILQRRLLALPPSCVPLAS